jgi:hypothetical protein
MRQNGRVSTKQGTWASTAHGCDVRDSWRTGLRQELALLLDEVRMAPADESPLRAVTFVDLVRSA